MNAEWKQKWIDALQSGEYTQTTDGKLRVREDFCCLGVLCDITKNELGLVWERNSDGDYVIGEQHISGLPPEVLDLVGLPINDGLVDILPVAEYNQHTCLAHLNDAGADFSFIADVIEAQF